MENGHCQMFFPVSFEEDLDCNVLGDMVNFLGHMDANISRWFSGIDLAEVGMILRAVARPHIANGLDPGYL